MNDSAYSLNKINDDDNKNRAGNIDTINQSSKYLMINKEYGLHGNDNNHSGHDICDLYVSPKYSSFKEEKYYDSEYRNDRIVISYRSIELLKHKM